jgi:hypothetical protein
VQPRTFIIDQPEQLPRFSAFLQKQDLPLNIEVRPHIGRRTNEQNARLWKLHTLAAEHVGCSSADMHEDMLCEHYGYAEVKLPSGHIKRIPLKRSSQRDKKEFRAFMDFVENFYASNLGVWLTQD